MIVVLCGAVAAFGVDDISINDTSSNNKVVLLRCCFLSSPLEFAAAGMGIKK
jgi:hypothetical protein